VIEDVVDDVLHVNANSLVLEPLVTGRDVPVSHYVVTLFTNVSDAWHYAEASSNEADMGQQRREVCRLAAEQCARKGEYTAHDMVHAAIPLLSQSKAIALCGVIAKVLAAESMLTANEFAGRVQMVLGDEALVFSYFIKCVHHYGTTCFCDP